MPEARPSDSPDAELEELVQRTQGLQVWRRLFHATNGTLIVASVHFGVFSRDQMVLLLAGALLGGLAVDLIRLRMPSAQKMFFRSFSALASPREAGRLASSTFYLAGALLAFLLFPLNIAKASILVLAYGDPAASYVGRRWGKIRFGDGGSVRGTAVFFIVALIVLLLFFDPAFAVGGAIVATIVERIPWRIDDNLTLPVGVGLALLLLGRLFGM